MIEFTRAQFSADQIRQMRRYASKLDPVYIPHKRHLVPSRIFSSAQVLAILQRVVGDTVTQIFLNENAPVTLEIGSRVLDDHVAGPESLKPKDLQLNLIVNLIVQCVRSQNLPSARRYGYAETLIRKCKFDAVFKHQLKVAVFDNKALGLPWLVISSVATQPASSSK